jgi:hypothetical protein
LIKEDIGGMEVLFHAFLISAIDGGGWSTSSNSHFTPPPEKEFLIPPNRSSVDLTADLGTGTKKETNPFP